MDLILTVVLTVEVLVWALVGCGYVWWRRAEDTRIETCPICRQVVPDADSLD